jgi:hypothetical protein
MPKKDSLIDMIEDFVNAPRSAEVTRKVSKYKSKAGSKGWTTEDRVLKTPEVNSAAVAGGKPKEEEWNAVQAFFAPVGYRPLFEQEIVFLMNEGLTYEAILHMPVHMRKMLIDRKLERGKPKANDEPDLPPALLEQFRMAAQERRDAESPLPVES